ncbi:MAG TPA: (Fe-S)-binding protein [Acidimicrobiales bacterium]|nr:(Fe-S)-binding protein [Acidimicrobiales bacterium]
MRSPLPYVADADLATCVACGLCLPHCPTYRVSGEESASPRGRIAAMRAVQAGAAADDSFIGFMDACVMCRGCEAACPSSVPFGRLMEGTRRSLAEVGRYQPAWRRAGYRLLGRHRLLMAATTALAVAQRLGLVPRRLGLPRLPLRPAPLQPTGSDVVLFTGCVMDAWMRPVHAAAVRVMTATGAGVALSPAEAGCCGALAAHAGLHDLATAQAGRVVAALPGTGAVVVDSAGCGAAMKDYGAWLGPPGEAFAARVKDVGEWLAERSLPAAGEVRVRVAVQDPCHLRHVQRSHLAVRRVLAPYAEVVELDDDGLCCGAGGAYAGLHPETAAAIRSRKLEAIARSGADVVVSANPGCAMHLSAAGVTVRHPVEVIDAAMRAADGRGG